MAKTIGSLVLSLFFVFLAQTWAQPLPEPVPSVFKNSPFAYPPAEFERRTRLQSSSAAQLVRQEVVKKHLVGPPVTAPQIADWVVPSGVHHSRIGEVMERGSRLEVPEEHLIRLTFRKGAYALLPPQTQVSVPADSYPVPTLKVEKGIVRFLVSQFAGVIMPKRPIRLMVFTPQGVVGVRGTDFSVEVLEGRTVVRVSSGKVWIAKVADDLLIREARVEVLSPSVVDLEADPAPLQKPRDFDWFSWSKEFERVHPAVFAQMKKMIEEQKSAQPNRMLAPAQR